MKSTMFVSNFNQAQQHPVASLVASRFRARLHARRCRKMTSWNAPCRTRVWPGHPCVQCHNSKKSKKELWMMSPAVAFFFLPDMDSKPMTWYVPLHRTGDPPAGFPRVQALQRP